MGGKAAMNIFMPSLSILGTIYLEWIPRNEIISAKNKNTILAFEISLISVDNTIHLFPIQLICSGKWGYFSFMKQIIIYNTGNRLGP